MKINISFYFIVFLSLACTHLHSQFFVDLKTGVDNTGNLITNGFDDDWQVSTSLNGPYSPVRSGNGIREGLGTVFPNKSSAVGWLSPYTNPLTGEYLQNLQATTHYYKRSFFVSSCAATSTTLYTEHALGDNTYVNLYINGSVAFLWAIPGTPFTSGNYYYIFGGLPQGWNTVIFAVADSDGGWTGFEFDGNITMQTCAYVELKFKDKDGNEKSEFCLDEDVFLDATGVVPSSTGMQVSKITGTSTVQIASLQNLSLPPNGVNFTEYLINATQNLNLFQPNQTYQLKLTMGGPCGQFDYTKEFSFVCCANSPDASFSLQLNNTSKLTVNSSGKGISKWEVYNTPAVNTGPYTLLGNSEYQKFSLNEAGPCCYVSHTLTNACGTSCTARTVCNLNCEQTECVLSAPTNVTINTRGNSVAWNSVTGASSYLIEVTFDDPYCCGTGTGGSTPLTYKKYVNVSGTSHMLTNAELGITGPGPHCFAVRVYAVCSDGSRSNASQPVCSM